MQSLHTLCFEETIAQHIIDIDNYSHAFPYRYIHAFHKHGILMVYGHHIIYTSSQTKTYNGYEFVLPSFNVGTCNLIHVITVYQSHSMKDKYF